MGGGATVLVQVVHDDDGGEKVVGLVVEASEVPTEVLHGGEALEEDVVEDGKIPPGGGGVLFWLFCLLHGRRGGGGRRKWDDEADRLGHQAGVLVAVDKKCLPIWLGLCHLVTQFKGQAALAALPGPQEAHPVDAPGSEERMKDCSFRVVMRLREGAGLRRR